MKFLKEDLTTYTTAAAEPIVLEVKYFPLIHSYFLLLATNKDPIQMSQCDICDM